MPSLTFYHAPMTRGAVVRWMLEEVGTPYDLHLLNLKDGDQRKPEYLAVNPQGKVPALRHGEAVFSEVAAICTYLADAFPDAKLNVPVGDPCRGVYLQWLFFGPSCIEPAMMDRSFPRQAEPPPTAVGYRDLDALLDIVVKAVVPGPYLMGDQFTAADVVVGAGLRFGMMFKMIPERPELVAYVKRLEQRPAFRRAGEKDAELAAA